MATYTELLKLLKKDPAAEGSDTFNIKTMLNNNWDKLDDHAKAVMLELLKKADLDEEGRVPAGQLPEMDYVPTGDKGRAGGVAELGMDGKVPAEQLPEMDYDPGGSAAAVEAKLGAHTGSTDNPHRVTAAQAGARPSTWVPAWEDVTGKPVTFPPDAHTHDDRYYTETEVDGKLAGKAPAYGYGTEDLTAETSPLENGRLYFVYE